mgnify:CR=1 FL=1
MFHMADIDRNGLLNFPEFVAAPGQIHGMGMDQCRYFFSHGMIVGYSHEDSVVVVALHISEQSHFKVCFWPFGFINNPALLRCFFSLERKTRVAARYSQC